jgi:dihydrofolate reductase
MRKLIVLTFMTMDGVMQAPGGPNEDASGGFTHGGWSVPYFDEFMSKVMGEQMGRPFDLVLGRKTYDIFAAYWPNQDVEKDPGAAALNTARKYVASNSRTQLDWQNSVVLKGDVGGQIRKLKAGEGPELQVHGSAHFIQTLLREDLVDELWLKVFPITVGSGKRLFADGTTPGAFTLQNSQVSPKGVIVASYKRAGELTTGTF